MTIATLEYINSQRAIWGDEYVDDLIDRKYLPALTSAGWRWIYVSDEIHADYIQLALDTASVLC